MLQYAQDAAETETPWKRWQTKDTDSENWRNIFNHPNWYDHYEYRRKPRVIVINGIEVPEPMRNAPENGSIYFFPRIDVGDKYAFSTQWSGDYIDEMRLKSGICHSTREAAELHAKALLSFTKKEETK